MAASDPKLHRAVLEHLEAFAASPSCSVDLSGALASLSEAFGLPSDVKQTSYAPVALAEIFRAGVEKLGLQTEAERVEKLKANPLFTALLQNLTSRGFFKGVEEGSPEYEERFAKVVAQYEQRKKKGAASAASAEKTAAPSDVQSKAEAGEGDAQAQAEAFKAEGNAALKAGDHEAAIAKYTQALDVSPSGPQSHIYLSNRAAAYCHMKDYASAVEDCKNAIALNGAYAKAHARLGFAYFYQEDYVKAEAAYATAVELEPSSKNNTEYLQKCRAKLSAGAEVAAATPAAAGAGASGGMPAGLGGLAGLMGGAGGAGGLAGLMQNPQMMAMAQQMMSDPAAMQMAQQMMSDPSAMNNMLSALGGLGGAPGGGTPGSGAGDGGPSSS